MSDKKLEYVTFSEEISTMKRPIAIDLFAGCGGMSLGLEAAGFDIAVAVEFDAVHSLVHHVNFPYTKNICKDISQLKSTELLQAVRSNGYLGEIDLIAGGPPCQGFSQIGKRQLDDERNSLVFEYLRIIKDIKPKYFIFENVPGIAIGKHKKFLDELMVEFKKIGYVVGKEPKILDASLFGAPQKRKRLIIIGSRVDVAKVNYPNETHTDHKNSKLPLFDQHLEQLTTVGDAISDLSIFEAYTGGDNGILAKDLDYKGLRRNFSFEPSGIFSLCHKRKVQKIVFGHIGSKHTQKSINRFEKTIPGCTEKISRFYKLSVKGQCNTLRAGTASDKGAYTAPRPIHYEKARCITVREAARLHTYPDWFLFHNTIWHGFREIGNSVIPFLSKALGDQVIKSLNIKQDNLTSKNLEKIDNMYLGFNMGKASKYWDVPNNIIAKRQRLKKDAA
jgi:DNA (cytosine-5)-methyltransferase 1